MPSLLTKPAGLLFLAAAAAAGTSGGFEQFITHFTYFGVVAVLVGGGFGLPIPEDIPLLLGGYLCSKEAEAAIGSRTHLHIMLPITFLAVVGTDWLVFWMGRVLGPRVTSFPILGRHLKPERLVRARKFLADHGGKSLFIARFLPGLRSVAFVSAGALHVPFWKMVVYDGSAALISVPTLVLVGWYFAEYFDEARIWVMHAEHFVLAVIVLSIVGFVIIKKMRKSRKPIAEPAPLPQTTTSER